MQFGNICEDKTNPFVDGSASDTFSSKAFSQFWVSCEMATNGAHKNVIGIKGDNAEMTNFKQSGKQIWSKKFSKKTGS